jgi:hypothetical protein
MDETYRMLGREHEADLAREAKQRQLAAAARAGRHDRPEAPEPGRRPRRFRFVPARVAALLR